MPASSYCIVIPHFRHERPLAELLRALAEHALPVLVVDDCSGPESLAVVKAAACALPRCRVLERAANGGKGAAMITGLRAAAADGYTHAISLDADGQHEPADVPRLEALSRQAPDCIFSGRPMFGDDIPASRLHGRKITNTLVQLEAGTTTIKDAMCGFRAYPLVRVLPLCDGIGYRTRMEFDVEILVRAGWAGIEVRYFDTRVVYPEEGASHFNLLTDNARLVAMHTLLIVSALYRVPARGLRRLLER